MNYVLEVIQFDTSYRVCPINIVFLEILNTCSHITAVTFNEKAS